MIQLHDTLSRKLTTLQPIDNRTVKIYSCGPTVYHYLHVGNWSAYIYWDILVRTLLLNNYEVKRVINITDVGHLTSDADVGEDKMVKIAKIQHTTTWKIAQKYLESFLEGFDELQLIKPAQFSRATDFIKEQLSLIQQLKNNGLTYQINDGIYLDTSKVKDYGKLAQLKLDKLKAGARVSFNQQKRNPTDFALWKFTQNGNRDMEWPTPPELLEDPAQEIMGFPGWHIECSAIIAATLGQEIDIHTGGIDHIPVHHTNEIAQSESVFHKPLAKLWVHNNHLKSNGVKISKSLGNGYTLTDIKQHGFSVMDFKMFVLQSHYQTEGNFSFKLLLDAKNRLAKWYKIAELRHQTYDGVTKNSKKTIAFRAERQHLLELANDNLNTTQILTSIDQCWTKLRANLNLAEINQTSLVSLLQRIDDLLGLDLLANTPDITEHQKQLIIQRRQAKNVKDYAIADQARQQLLADKIELIDFEDQTIWQRVRD